MFKTKRILISQNSVNSGDIFLKKKLERRFDKRVTNKFDGFYKLSYSKCLAKLEFQNCTIQTKVIN